jgi:hypothetical protein
MEQKLLHQHIATVVDKKRDPNYGVVRGFVPQDLLKRFKVYCVELGMDNSQGLENLLTEFFQYKDSQQNEPLTDTSPNPSSGKSRRKKGGEE